MSALILFGLLMVATGAIMLIIEFVNNALDRWSDHG